MTGVIERVDVAVLPAEAAASGADCFVVVDLLRATTHIAALFAAGLEDLVVVDSIDAAHERAQRESRILLGEVGGLPPPGFDYGNSPGEVRREVVGGKGAVLFTTNGTNAICICAGRGTVFSGALVNLEALRRELTSCRRVLVVCAGLRGGMGFALEDFLAAGRIVAHLDTAESVCLGDAARAARDLASLRPPLEAINGGEHAASIRKLGFGPDIEFAAQQGILDVAPKVVEYGQGWARLIDAAAGDA